MKNRLFLSSILLFLAQLCCRAQIGGDYNPESPSDPGLPVQKYALALKATPADGGSFNVTSTKVPVGERYNLRAYPNTDFTFVAWLCDGDTLSKSASYDYVMPAHNVEVTGVFSYSPSSPSNPQEPVLKYQLSLVAEPMNSGSFNLNNERLAVGSNNSLRAYTNTDFVFKHWVIGDSVLSTNPNMNFVMPSHNVQMVGVFEYNPASPANPNRNHWDKLTGEVIVDDFTPGNLSSAISTVISGSSSNDVQTIIVAGRITSNDFGIANNYKNCSLLDLSRVTGVTEVPSYAFDYTNLETVYLPATIEKIGSRAFAECSKLSSLTIYAMTPPTLESQVFQGVPEGLVVYVPAVAIAQYQDIEAWGKFTLLPIQEDIRSISISLPEDSKAADYAKMWLELTNTKSGQRMHYVMTERTRYTFANIIRNTSWNVTLRNERGDVFGKIDNVEVKDEDVTVAFASLTQPKSVNLSVKTPDGQDVTQQTQITWTNAEGKYLSQGCSLTGLPVGYQTKYKVILSEQLAMLYNVPAEAEYTLTATDNNPVCQLTAIGQVKVSGKVVDKKTNQPVNGAVISASQTFGSKYSKTFSCKTDNKGEYSIDLYKVPSSIAFSAADYVSQTLGCDSIVDASGALAMQDVALKEIAGAVISLSLTYTPCAEDGETAEVQNWFNDYNNVGYTLYNKTKNRTISQFNVQYPQIVLLEEVADGDELLLTATSKTGAFMPVQENVFIAEQAAEATVNIIELGKIDAAFSKNINSSVKGILYDGNGKLVKSYDYTQASLSIGNLTDGSYTLVSMGDSKLFSSIYDLSQFSQAGLTEGTDYVKNTVAVQSGKISKISIEEIPTFNESKLYYTGENTSFTVNKSSIVAGNYLTLSGRIDFKPAYVSSVSNIQMVVDLPENCSFVENSVMVGNSISRYILNGNRLTIPVARLNDRIRFCVIPTLGGDYAPSAFAQFDMNGETITQPIGSVNYTAKDLSIVVPSTVARTTVPVSGTAIGKCDIEIYDNDMLVGQTTSLANGTWATNVELNEPYNLSTHNIYAKVTTKSAILLTSEIQSCTYNKDEIFAKTVDMTFYNGWMKKNITVTFDLENQTSDATSYSFYHETDFTFTANLSNNDTTVVKGVTISIYTDHKGWMDIEATYNENINRWIAVHKFGSNNLPIGVKVEVDAVSNNLVDANLYDNTMKMYDTLRDDILEYGDKQEKISAELILEWDKEHYNHEIVDSIKNEIYKILGYVYNEHEVTIYKEDNINALIARCDSVLNDTISPFKESFLKQTIYDINGLLEGISIKNTEGISESLLLSLGYEKITKTDNSYIYLYYGDTEYKYVDFVNNVYYEVDLQKESILAKAIRKSNSYDNFPERIQGYIQALGEGADRLRSYMSQLASTIEDIERAVDVRNGKIADQLFDLDATINSLEKRGASNFLIKPLKFKYNALVAEGAINAKILAWFEKNISAKGLRVGRLGGGTFAVFDIVKVSSDMVNDLNNVIDVYFKIPNPCDNEESKAKSLRNSVVAMGVGAGIYYGAQIVSDAAQIALAITGSAGAVPSGGTTLSAVGIAIGLAVANVIASEVYSANFDKNLKNTERQIRLLNCTDDKCPRCHKNPCECKTPCSICGHKPCICCHYCNHYPCTCTFCPKCGKRMQHCICKKCKKCGNVDCICRPIPEIPPILDPSGYVYEAVATNRLEGVTATCFYKETVEDMYGDLHENIVKWDAAEYAQENPLFTDENGYYRWDVPQGLWQVKFEKEGYETTYSEWLPVPPPQLDVNIAMKQNVQPVVKNARAFEDAVEVEFDKYMIPELLNTDNILVMADGKALEGKVELLNEEVSYEGNTDTYASKIRFNAVNPFPAKDVTLLVKNQVKSYAGIRMQEDYQQDFTVEQEIKQIVCDSLAIIDYGKSSTLTVEVLPASASKGKALTIKTSSPMILGVETAQVTVGDDGKAEITVSGELPGTAALTFTVEGTDRGAQTIVSVEQKAMKIVALPKASIASGTVVEKGMAVTLSCETKGATIYYTLDGSCPCDATDARKVYDGTPITINESMTIKAMAVAPDMYESGVVEFVYFVGRPTGVDEVTMDALVEIFPLPVRGILNVTAGGKTVKGVSVYSAAGNLVAASRNATTKVTLDVSNLPAGNYIVSVSTEEGVVSRKIQKVL